MSASSATRSEETYVTQSAEEGGALGDRREGYTQRTACHLVGMEPKTYRYVSTRPDEAGLRVLLKQLANVRRRVGYRWLRILLKRADVTANHKKLFFYSEQRLIVRRRGGRKGARNGGAVESRAGAKPALGLDFVSDALAYGRRFRVLVVVDAAERACQALVVETALSGGRVVRALNAIICRRGSPLTIASHNGTELLRAVVLWQEGAGVE